MQFAKSLLLLASLAQAKLSDEAGNNLKTLINNTLNTTIVWDRLAEMTDTFGHRLVGSKGLEDSIDWIVKLIKKDGIKVYTEDVSVAYWRREHESLKLLTKTRGQVDMKVTALGNSTSTPRGGVTAEVVPVSGWYEFDQLLAKDPNAIKGKVILFNFPWVSYGNATSYRNSGAKKAEDYGAVASMIRSASSFDLSNVHTGWADDVSNIASVAISPEDAGLIHRMYKRASKQLATEVLSKKQIQFPKVHLNIQTKFDNNTRTSRNIIAEIPGCEYPDEYVVFGGHSDSWDLGVGALDDGAGSFTAYEALRQISKLPMKPKRTIQAVFWTSEENGGFGGIQFAKNREHLKDNIVFAMESDFNSGEPNGISFTGNPKQEQFLEETAKTYLQPHGFGYNVGKDYDDLDIEPLCRDGNTPCASFDSGVPVKNTYFNTTMGENNEQIPDGYFWYHHTDADRMEAVKPEQLAKCSATMATYVYAIAQNDESLHKMK
ncbi:Zn-dependent exopeptidase [Conidiobolus coronatus NRRL 28638]|uniref:Peptide hydrolase n=1 Tax=Conidiobolus coronatus (strain ATCC 28846 / CBS 209.66 / NRRL 28638) TaxID=796925 RepID=A0A137NT91_CONC2|nr:Zn-dependent exopeptidase [Conidiobolus coronatus NRRL 28638]|eukprot:KXN65993.1 Zn-dependent exopeptidase [Conidiobolus coronatus NRRL 28638]